MTKRYEDVRWCFRCQKDTLQEVTDSEHERDSSGDQQHCKECGWTYSGLTGKWHSPDFREEIR
jgi:hypothetical protein